MKSFLLAIGDLCAHIPHYAVHSRLEGRAETLAHFKNKALGQLGHDHAQLAACLADLDTGIGQVLEKIKALGIEQNTLVIFTSDNGGPHVTQEPLRGAPPLFFRIRSGHQLFQRPSSQKQIPWQ